MGKGSKGKTRVGVIVRESIGTKSHNKSSDLMTLTKDYQAWGKKIRSVVVALQAHHASMVELERSRSAVAKSFAMFSEKTPLHESTGVMPSADRPSNSVNSYASIHDTLSAKNKSYVQKYQQFVIEYALEWEKVVTGRINNGLKITEDLRRDLDHYQKKVEALRLSTNKAMANGKSVKTDTAEKLKRNEEKLIASKQVYNKAATDLCILMEEVTERSWRDLHPLLLKSAQFDMTVANDEASILGSLQAVVSALKAVATSNGLSPQPRLKDLASVKPELLSTRPGGVAGLAIDAGPSLSSPTATASSAGSPTSLDVFAQPPGSVAPQGMGGFPVAVSNALPTPSGSMNSFGAAPPTASMNMMSLSAPAPTMDDVYSLHQSSPANLMIQSAPSSGNVQTMPPSNFRHSTSFNDMDNLSAYSGNNSAYSAPPAGAPPPPSMPPPPPPPTPQNYGAPAPVGGYGAPDPPSFGAPPQWPQPSYGDPPAAPSSFGMPPANGYAQPHGGSSHSRF